MKPPVAEFAGLQVGRMMNTETGDMDDLIAVRIDMYEADGIHEHILMVSPAEARGIADSLHQYADEIEQEGL